MIHMEANTPEPWRGFALTQHRRGIDPTHVQPIQGQIYHLCGPGRSGKSMRTVSEHWVACALARGEVVHWVDGACRIDPARFIPLLEFLEADVEACLARLYLSRGFTLHQLDRQLERLPDELAITRSPMVVVDGLLAMHNDDAISPLESRTLLRRHVHILRKLVHKRQTAVVAITGRADGSHTNTRHIEYIQRHAQNHLEGRWQGRRRHRRLHLRHHRTGISGHWSPFHIDPQTRFQFPPPQVIPQNHLPPVDILPLHHRHP